MNKIPDAYKEAVKHVEQQEKLHDESFEQWKAKKKNQEKNLVVTPTSFFVPDRNLEI